MDKCHFCPRPAPAQWALTACKGDPADAASWRREILPLCTRCDALITQAGDKGRVLKATGERWFGGHRVGLFESWLDTRESGGLSKSRGQRSMAS